MEALKQAKRSIPEGRWWIKADGCDVRKGLWESMRSIWSGDKDLGDGTLQALYDEYKVRCAFVKGIGTSGGSRVILNDVGTLLVELQKDLEFLSTGADAANGVHPLCLHRLRINRREDASILCAGRAFLPACNQTTIHQRTHRPLAQLPDPVNRAS